MAAMKTGKNLDKWRNYFRTSTSDVFDIIQHGIMVAASDYPQEFRLRRDRIAETLFSSKLSKCVGCDRVELPVAGEEREDDGGCKIGCGNEFEAGRSKESKVDTGRDDHGGEMNVNQMVSNYSYRDAEALTDEIEEESQIFGEVLRIKEIVENSEDESYSLLFDSLRRLELMALSVEVLKNLMSQLPVRRMILQQRDREMVQVLFQVNSTGAKVLEYISDFGKPSAPLHAVIVIVACVPKKVHADGIGEFEFKIVPTEIISAIKEGLQEPIEAEPELEVPKEFITSAQWKN